PTYGKKNKLFTEDAAAKARELLKSKLGQLSSGLDPEMMQAGITLAGYHIEAGAKSFTDYSKAMIADLGDAIKPFLRSFYEGVRYYPGMDNEGMSSAEEIAASDKGVKKTGQPELKIEEHVQEALIGQAAGHPGQQVADQVKTTLDATPQDAFNAVFDNGDVVRFADGSRLERRRVSGEDRIEIKGIEFPRFSNMEKYGMFSERINWQTRFFIPTSQKGIRVIEKLMVRNPVAQIDRKNQGQGKYSKVTEGPLPASEQANARTELEQNLGKKETRNLERNGSLRIVSNTQAKNILAGPSGAEAKKSYAGQSSMLADQTKLLDAIRMKKSGEDSETIRQETGWFKAKDGKWRYEISDKGMKIDYSGWINPAGVKRRIGTKQGVKIGDILQHGELLSAYPPLRDIEVRLQVKPGFGKTEGHYDGARNEIVITAPSRKALESALLHELQHAVQGIEGFSKGGAPSMFDIGGGMEGTFAQLAESDPEISKGFKEGDKAYRRGHVETALKMYEQATREGTFKAYQRLHGEVEARDAATRKDLTDEQRRLMPPYVTEGIREDDMILRGSVDVKYSKDGRIEAFTLPDGTVYMVEENIRKGETMAVLSHELGVHAKQLGFKDTKKFKRILDMLKRRSKKATAEGRAIREAMDRVPNDTKPEHRDEEALAYLISNSPEINIVQRFIAAVKKFLIEKLNISERILSNIDMQALSLSVVKRESKVDNKVDKVVNLNDKGLPKGIAFSVANEPKNQKETQQAIRSTEDLNAKKDGVESETSTEKGASIIFDLLEKLKASKVAGPPKKYSNDKIQALIQQYSEVAAIMEDPHKSIAEKQKFAAGFARRLPAEPRSMLLQKLSQIARCKTTKAQGKHLLAFLERAEREVAKYLKKELIRRVEKRSLPTMGNVGERKGKSGKDIARGRGPKLERDLRYLRDTAFNLMDQEAIENEINRLNGMAQSLENRLMGAKNDKARSRLRNEIDNVESYINIADLFGALHSRNFSELVRARDALEYIFENGTAEWRMSQEFWRNRNEINREAAARDITGLDNPTQETVAEESRRMKKESTVAGKTKEILSAVSNSIQSWELMLDKISGRAGKGTLKSWLVNHFGSLAHKGTRDYERMQLDTNQALMDKAAEIFKVKPGYQLAREFSKANKKVEGKVFTYSKLGKESLSISPLEAAYWYQISKDKTNPVMQQTMEKMGITDLTMSQIERLMGPKVKAWADYLVDDFYQDFHDGINDIYKQVYGIDLEKNKNYVPWRRKVTGRAADKQQEGFLAGIAAGTIKKGSLKLRTTNYLPFRQVNMNDVLMSHVADMNHFKAWAIPSREINGTFNDPKIQKHIRQHYGASSLRAIRKFQSDFVKSENELRDDMMWVDKWRGRIATSTIGANPVVFLKQLSSIPAYASDIPAVAWSRHTAYALTHPVKVAKVLGESTMMKSRYKKGFERDVANAMRRGGSDMIAQGRRIPDKLMVLTALGDRLAIVTGGYAVYKHHYLQNKKKSGYTKERAHREALTAFEKATERAQQSGNVKDLGSFQRGGPVMKLFTMYMTAPASYSRQIFTAVRNIKTDPVDSMKRLFIYGVVLPMLFQAVADAFMVFGGDDDNRFWKNQAKALVLGPFNGLPIIRDLSEGAVNAASGEFWMMNRLSYSPVTEAGKSGLNAIYHGSKGFREDDTDLLMKALLDTTEFMGYLSGYPVRPVGRIVTGVKDSATGETEYPVRRSIGYSKYAVGEN
ncbi:MAG: hypothetical protein DRH10_01030, partial [Deltaproteobacteria bacterium]